jgi:hypothetical protein
MSANLPAPVQSQLGRLTATDKKRLAGIIDDCSGALREVYRLLAAADPSGWAPARRKLLSCLAQMQALVEAPPVLHAIATEGPDAAAAGYRGPGAADGWRTVVDERHNLAREALAGLKRVIEEQHGEAAPVEPEQYVTLDQAAALVNRAKKTLERRLNRQGSDAPPPDVEGGGGRAHEWRWSALRPWLEQTYGKKLPERFPSRRPLN